MDTKAAFTISLAMLLSVIGGTLLSLATTPGLGKHTTPVRMIDGSKQVLGGLKISNIFGREFNAYAAKQKVERQLAQLKEIFFDP